MPDPAVSVIIPAYNSARFLPGCLASVLSQDYPVHEIIVSDDGSTDNIEDALAPFLADPRVRLLSAPNAGPSAARNRGIRAATGDAVAFLDADDLWLPGKLSRQIPLLAPPRVGLVYGLRTHMDPDGNPIPKEQPDCFRGNVLSRIFSYNFVCTSSAVVKKQCFETTGFFDESLTTAEDFDLWIRIAAFFDFDFVPEPVACYRTGHPQLSQDKDLRLINTLLVRQRALKHPAIAGRIPPSVVRRARSDTMRREGLRYAGHGRRDRALFFYLRALAADPLSLRPWRAIAKLILKNSGKKNWKLSQE
ncbi:MAG: glycosyltransferase [Thermodesulfobacteriota bacterium]